jgi:hypothetical protein
MQESIAAKFVRVESGFLADGFSVVPLPVPGSPSTQTRFLTIGGALGVRAERPAAPASDRRKTAFYLEGDGYQMGWMMGYMAEADVSRMATEFVENVAFAFFDESATEGGLLGPLKDLIVRLIGEASGRILPDIPLRYVREIDGIVDGCMAANAGTFVRRDRLLALNLGIDCVLAHLYTGRLFRDRGFHPRQLKTAIGCNAFSLSGAAAGGRHFFGRDFMFPTANVFQDSACVMIYVPAAEGDPPRAAPQPFIGQSAPGFVGCMAGMNRAGVAMGVNMLPGALCDPDRPGLNSLLLVRDCIQHCTSAREVVDRVQEAPRGVSWLYPVADRHGEAFAIEAGRKVGAREPFPYFSFIPRAWRRLLPRRRFIEQMRRRYGTPPPKAGMVARGNGYHYPMEYLSDWNPGLWRGDERNWLVNVLDILGDLAGLVGDLLHGRVRGSLREEVEKLVREAVIIPDAFTERGAINRTWRDRNCPGPFYFAPQRESRPDVLVATNASVTPEMRLTCMTEWLALLAGRNLNDIQWRYDELSREILDALDAAPQGIGEETAWDIIDFLRPNGRFPSYYNHGPAEEWAKVQVHGSVTLCELTGLSFRTRFGYYGDAPVTLHLGAYLA